MEPEELVHIPQNITGANFSEGASEVVSAYDKYPFLEDYRSFFGDLGIDRVIGEGNYGVIIYGQTGEKVYKIGKNPEFSKMLLDEYNLHVAFYTKLEELRRALPELVPSNLRIPEVSMEPLVLPNGLFIYEMEFIRGDTLNRLDMLREYPMSMPNIQYITDWGLIAAIQDKFQISEEEITLPRARGIVVLKDNFAELGKQVSEALDALRNLGYEHLDLHSGNIMISQDPKDGVTAYIIDFGKSKVPH